MRYKYSFHYLTRMYIIFSRVMLIWRNDLIIKFCIFSAIFFGIPKSFPNCQLILSIMSILTYMASSQCERFSPLQLLFITKVSLIYALLLAMQLCKLILCLEILSVIMSINDIGYRSNNHTLICVPCFSLVVLLEWKQVEPAT